MPIIICPSCQKLLIVKLQGVYSCENGHSFDLSKEGYLNLLLANKKKSNAPGDNKLMIEARRSFLEKGTYNPLVIRLKKLIQNLLANKEKITALDVGCGEGYYTENILNSLSNKTWDIYGIDMSKYAVRKAAKKYKDINFLVASAFDLPITDHSITFLLSIFAPIDVVSFSRVLSEEGFMVCVTAGKQHMKEMAQQIYDEFRPHKSNLEEKLNAKFSLQNKENISYPLVINSNDDLMDLLKMTPYYYKCNKDQLDKISKINTLTLTCDFNISIFRLK